MNDKIDLSQAKAVADLTASTSADQHRLVLGQMRGDFSKELAEFRNQLLYSTSPMELKLDFGDHEELELVDCSELHTLMDYIEQIIFELVQSFSAGNVVKNGAPVAIIGETDTDKSILLNALLNEDKAIVSDIRRTARDVIEDTINVNGQPFRFIDIASVRETGDTIKVLGIECSLKVLDQVQTAILMYDLTCDFGDFKTLCQEITPRLTNKPVISVINKRGVLPTSSFPTFSFLTGGQHQIAIPVKGKPYIAELQQLLTEVSSIPTLHQNDIIVTNARHFEIPIHVLKVIHRVQEGLNSSLSESFILQDLRECILHLSGIIGEVITDQVSGNILQYFYTGKWLCITDCNELESTIMKPL